MKKDTRKNEPLISKEPLRYRLRARLLHQKGSLPDVVRRYLRQAFPCMCGLKYKHEVSHI